MFGVYGFSDLISFSLMTEAPISEFLGLGYDDEELTFRARLNEELTAEWVKLAIREYRKFDLLSPGSSSSSINGLELDLAKVERDIAKIRVSVTSINGQSSRNGAGRLIMLSAYRKKCLDTWNRAVRYSKGEMSQGVVSGIYDFTLEEKGGPSFKLSGDYASALDLYENLEAMRVDD